MRRFLLALVFLFSLLGATSQVILNELYTDPSINNTPVNHEFFELYNTSRTTPINLDCYSLIVFYDTRPNSTSNQGERGFYVLDFPNLSIEPLGYFVGSAKDPTFFVQKCTNLTPAFSWNNLKDKYNNSGFLRKYELRNGSYTVTGAGNQPFTIDDFFTDNKNGTTRDPGNADGFVYAVFLFNNGNYVNGFLGGSNSQTVSSVITSMPPLPYVPNCSTLPHNQIDWRHVVRAEKSI